MKKLSLVVLAAAVVISAGCRKKTEKVVVVERDYENEYDDYGRPVHDHSTTVKKNGNVVKYVQKNHKSPRTHVEID